MKAEKRDGRTFFVTSGLGLCFMGILGMAFIFAGILDKIPNGYSGINYFLSGTGKY